MDARRVGTVDEMVVIDGRPTEGTGNLMGYANFAVEAHANAAFRDDVHVARAPTGKSTFVRVYAKETIEEGQEVRIDYDMGDVQRRSFYTYLTEIVGGSRLRFRLRGLQGKRLGDSEVAACGSSIGTRRFGE